MCSVQAAHRRVRSFQMLLVFSDIYLAATTIQLYVVPTNEQCAAIQTRFGTTWVVQFLDAVEQVANPREQQNYATTNYI